MVIEKSVVEYGNRPLAEVVDPLRDEQRWYLYLVLAGMNKDDALGLVKRSEATLKGWQFHEDSPFREIEKYVLANRDKYTEEAAREYARILRAKGILGLALIADKVYEWDSLDKVDKQSVMAALRELRGIGLGKSGAEDSGSYEELVLRKRVEM